MSKRLGLEEVRKRLEELGLELISEEYVSNQKPIEVRCKCGKIFSTSLGNISRHKIGLCPQCRRKQIAEAQRFDFGDMLEYIKQFELEMISKKEEYKNSKSVLRFRCKCGEIFETTQGALYHKNKTCCDSCTRRRLGEERKLELDYIKLFCKEKGVELLSEQYINNTTPLKFKCKCGEVFYKAWNNFVKNSRCKTCNKIASEGETRISLWLEENEIDFVSEYKIEECTDINPLPFDFAIFDNTGLLCLIEYDGIQHYEPRPFGSKNSDKIEQNFLTCQKHDKIKDNYCEEHGIKLIRIPYWDKNNIEKILTRELTNIHGNIERGEY